MPNAFAMRAMAQPMRPRPMIPKNPAVQTPALQQRGRPALPSPRPDIGIRLRHPPAYREQERHGAFRRRLRDDAGRVGGQDSPPGDLAQVEIVEADPAVGDQFKARRGIEEPGVYLVSHHRDENVRFAHGAPVAGGARLHVFCVHDEVGGLLQIFKMTRRKLPGEEYARKFFRGRLVVHFHNRFTASAIRSTARSRFSTLLAKHILRCWSA